MSVLRFSPGMAWPGTGQDVHVAGGGESICAHFVARTVAASVALVVHLGSSADGARRVKEIVAVLGRWRASRSRSAPQPGQKPWSPSLARKITRPLIGLIRQLALTGGY